MKRYPLQQLLELRAHRVEQARQVVLERQRAAQQAREACTQIEQEIANLDARKREQKRRLMDPPPEGLPWPSALAQREAHIDLLGIQTEAARVRLAEAHQALQVAERALDEARQAFLRAKAREDALEKRKGHWRGEQRALEARQEEAASDELVLANHMARAH